MKKVPHGLNVGCEYQILDKPKVVLKTAKVEGYITMGEGRTKITIPMRSWVKNFLDRLHNMLDGTATDTEIGQASIGASDATWASICDKAGILLGVGNADVTLTQTSFDDPKLESSQCEHKTTTLTKPYQSGRELITKISRLFTNASSTPWVIYELGLKTKKSASTASNAGSLLLSRDVYTNGYDFEALSDVRVEISLKTNLPTTGGPVLNLLRVFYNLSLANSANSAAWIPRSGTVTLSHAAASTSSSLVVDGGSGKYWGVVVGYYSSGSGDSEEAVVVEGPVGPDIDGDTNITADTINLYSSQVTYGANTVSAVVQAGNKAYFYVTRDITNAGTSTIKIDRIGLLAKGATASPTAFENGNIFLCMNKPNRILLASGQTLRVTYTFEINV